MLRLIAGARLVEVWGWVRSGLLACIEKTGERYLPEDVYAALRAGTSFLYVIEWQGDDIGFVVLQQHADPDGPVLFVWAMWTEPGAGAPVVDRICRALEAKGAEIGARRLRMHSPRRGWERQEYWRQVSAVYEHEVTR